MKGKENALVYVMLALLLFFLVRAFGLNGYCFLFLGAGGIWTIGKIQKYRKTEQMYETTYRQVTTYLEQLLCSYRRLGHAGKALGDCQMLFPADSSMGQAIERAKHILLTGDGVLDGNLLQAAFLEMEKAFDSRRMRIIHKFICNGEKTGAESGHSADILLEDLEMWKNRTRLYQSRKHFVKMECTIATVLAVMLCYVSRLLTPEELGFDITKGIFYPVSTTAAFLLMQLLLVTIYKKLSSDWLDHTWQQTEQKKKHKKRKNEIGERQVRLYRLLQKGAGSFLSRHMAKKILSRYVKAEFPYWLLLVTLYLQSESCYQALKYSMEEAEGVFRMELEKLVEAIYDSPRSLEPYLDFFSVLALPEVQSGMKILYSIQSNGYEDSKKQMDYLVAQNNRLMDKYESYVFTGKMAGMAMLKQLPMMVSCGKLLLDLVHLLAMTMGTFQSMSLG